MALVRRTSPEPANDNVPGTVTPEDGPFFVALALVCAAVLALAAYVALGGPGDVAAGLQR